MKSSALQRAENSQWASFCLPYSRISPVSVLFSEPKILNFTVRIYKRYGAIFCFSALQRAENSQCAREAAALASLWRFQCSSASRKFSIFCFVRPLSFFLITFQCSSASRKFSMLIEHQALERARECFSALQRAENSQ